jgi:hypothetical protein
VVSLGRVDPQLPQQLTGRRVDHADVEVLDEQDDVGSGVVPSDPDAVQLAIDPQRDLACLVDDVVAHT